jgi:hypothetical protein
MRDRVYFCIVLVNGPSLWRRNGADNIHSIFWKDEFCRTSFPIHSIVPFFHIHISVESLFEDIIFRIGQVPAYNQL